MVEYKSGKSNAVADALSRLPTDNEPNISTHHPTNHTLPQPNQLTQARTQSYKKLVSYSPNVYRS